MKYIVRTRYGWGFEIEGDGHTSNPFESAKEAQEVADDLNAGFDWQTAFERAERKCDFRNGRFYSKQAA